MVEETAGHGPAGDRVRAVCLGEALVVLRPEAEVGLVDAQVLHRSVGGAEANVAGGLAALGVRTAWVSRLGDDPFGDAVVADLAERDVMVVAPRDPSRPTGLYLKDSVRGSSRMHYYRAGSAAAAMDSDLFEDPRVAGLLATADLVHTSGITAGILHERSRLLSRLLELREHHGFRISVDLNWRPALWRGRRAGRLVDLARAADVLLLGADEAKLALGTDDPAELRSLVGPRPDLVVKADSHAATEYRASGEVTAVPALEVEVVEQIGAGDGFAAGYLAGLLDGEAPTHRLRLGHLTAAGVLAAPGDHAPPPSPAVREALLHASAADWSRTRVSARGVASPTMTGVHR